MRIVEGIKKKNTNEKKKKMEEKINVAKRRIFSELVEKQRKEWNQKWIILRKLEKKTVKYTEGHSINKMIFSV